MEQTYLFPRKYSVEMRNVWFLKRFCCCWVQFQYYNGVFCKAQRASAGVAFSSRAELKHPFMGLFLVMGLAERAAYVCPMQLRKAFTVSAELQT